MSVGAQDDTILIKKYGNRRLYDTQQSRYITLDDLAEIIKSGKSVKVTEAATDKDLTRQVLTQVILEQRDAIDMVPIELLQAIIRVRGTLEQAPFAAFLAATTRQLLRSGDLISQQMNSFFGIFPGVASTESPRSTASPATGSATTPEAGAPGNVESSDLRARMDRLLGKLGKA